MPQFNAYPALQARGIDIQDIQRRSLQNQLLQSKLQQAQNPQADPRLALDREKFEFSQDKDQRTQGLQHVKVLGQYAGAAARASGVQRVMIHGEAIKYAQANGIPTDGWRDPGDPDYVAWAQAQQARAGEAAKQADLPSGYQRIEGGLEFTPGGPADPAQVERLAKARPQRPSVRRYQATGPYVDSESGEFLGEGFYDRQDNKLTLKRGGKTIPMPENAMPRTEGGLIKGAMTGQQFHGLASEAAQEEKSLRELGRYMKNVQSTEQGWTLLADQFLGAMNTLFDGDLTPMQYRTLLQNGQLQGMLGGARLETVGPGVMTEQDAERILARLGGDVSVLRNREVAGQLIKEIMMEKVERYNNVTLPQYNYQTNIIPRGNFKEKEPISIDESIFAPSQTTAPDSGLSTEDEALVKKYLQ